MKIAIMQPYFLSYIGYFQLIKKVDKYVFDDKIEFYNPGKLTDGITIQDLIENNYKSSPRNKAIAEFFKNLGWIEKYGSGIRRIINYFNEAKLPAPTFQNQSNGFLVTVFDANTQDVVEDVVEKRHREIIKMILKDTKTSAYQIAISLNVTERTAQRDLEKLKNKGVIERIGPAKGGYWKVNEI